MPESVYIGHEVVKMNVWSYEKKEHIGIIKMNEVCCEDAVFIKELKEAIQTAAEDEDIYVLLLVADRWQNVRVNSENISVPVLAASKENLPEDIPGFDIVIVSDQPEEDGLKMAGQIAANAPIAVQQIKRCVNLGLKSDPEAGRAYELQAFALCHSTQDKQIGMKALLNNENEKVFLRK